jgi:hypothetical protein
MRKLLVVALVASALVAIPAGSAVADQAGFYGANYSPDNRINPFVDGVEYCASQNLGAWVFVADDSRRSLLASLEALTVAQRLDGGVVESKRSAVRPRIVDGTNTGSWMTTIGDPSVGPLALGSHTLITEITFEGETPFVVEIGFVIDDC